MSIAWATVVLVVLLLPGFFFFWGFYAPNQVTRESVPASPLGQLAGVVIFGFFVHGVAYWAINRHLCTADNALLPCVDFDQIAALVRIDGTAPQGKLPLSLNAMLDQSGGWVLLYFILTTGISFGLGYGAGRQVASGTLPLTRHRYLFMLEEARRQSDRSGDTPAHLVRAHVLSKTSNDGLVIIYDGVLRDFFAKADGTISYLVLRTPRSGTVKIEDGKSARSGQTNSFTSTGEDEAKAFLVITSDDIANVYFEPLLPVIKTASGNERLDRELELLGQTQAESGKAP